MAILDNVGGIVTKLGSVFLISVMVILLCGFVIGVIWLIMKKKLYQHYTVQIYKRKRDKEGNETLVFVGTDKAAIKLDKKTKKRFFHLRKYNVFLGEEESVNMDENRNLDIPSIPSEKGGEVVFLEKLGPRKFAIGTPFIVNGKIEIMVSEADVAEAIRSYDVNAKYYGKAGFWEKYGSTISFVLLAVFIIILIAVVLNKMEVLTSDGIKVVLENTGRGSVLPSSTPG